MFRESQEVSPESEMVKGVYKGFKKSSGHYAPPAANRVTLNTNLRKWF